MTKRNISDIFFFLILILLEFELDRITLLNDILSVHGAQKLSELFEKVREVDEVSDKAFFSVDNVFLVSERRHFRFRNSDSRLHPEPNECVQQQPTSLR